MSDMELVLRDDTKIGIWLPKDQVSRAQGFVSVGSKRLLKWQNLAYQATTDEEDPVLNLSEEYKGSILDRSQHTVPNKLMLRSGIRVLLVHTNGETKSNDLETGP